MFNFTFLQTMIAGFKLYTFNAYDFVQGDWMEMNIVNRTLHYPITLLNSYNSTEGGVISTYQTTVNSTRIELTITSSTHVKIKYGDTYPEFEIDIIQKPNEVAIFDGYLPEGIYSMMTFYAKSSLEISLVFPQDKQTIHTYGFFKQPSYQMDKSDYLMIIGLALFLTYLFKTCMKNAI